MGSAEDNLAGLDPSKGTETCATNEALLSLYVAGGCTTTTAPPPLPPPPSPSPPNATSSAAAAATATATVARDDANADVGGDAAADGLPLLDLAERIAYNALPGPVLQSAAC